LNQTRRDASERERRHVFTSGDGDETKRHARRDQREGLLADARNTSKLSDGWEGESEDKMEMDVNERKRYQ
jgi:hypothetical protein